MRFHKPLHIGKCECVAKAKERRFLTRRPANPFTTVPGTDVVLLSRYIVQQERFDDAGNPRAKPSRIMADAEIGALQMCVSRTTGQNERLLIGASKRSRLAQVQLGMYD